jgi:hydrogenase maturation protease
MSAGKVLVAGVGNVFLSDDGFGVEVARRLAGDPRLPTDVEVADFGIRGVHLAFQLLDGYDTVIIVDAASRQEAPGTVSVIEHELSAEGRPTAVVDAHGMEPDAVLGLLSSMGGHVGRILVVGCEPASVDEGMGLSPAVAGAVDTAVDAVLELLSTSEEPEQEAAPC